MKKIIHSLYAYYQNDLIYYIKICKKLKYIKMFVNKLFLVLIIKIKKFAIIKVVFIHEN